MDLVMTRQGTGTTSHNWRDRRKMTQGTSAIKDAGRTDDMFGCMTSDRYTERDEVLRCMDDQDCVHSIAEHLFD